MRPRHRFLPPALLAALSSAAFAADPPPSYKPDAGPHAIASLDTDWIDPARNNRTVPIRIYFPRDIASLQEKLPVILFSHGLGGARGGYALWSNHWASQGYVVIHPQHVGSDISIARSGRAFTDAINVQTGLDRVQDIHFVLDQVEKLHAGTLPGTALAPFKDRLDLARIGMAGHSFGAHTTLIVCGQTYTDPQGARRTAADPRIKAGIAMSPNQSFDTDQRSAFASIKVPVLHMTGTEDTVFTIKPEDHRIPFDNSKSEAYLITFQGANHITFTFPMGAAFVGSPNPPAAPPAARRNTPAPRTPPATGNPLNLPTGPANLTPATGDARAFTRLIRDSSTAFWDAHLKSNLTAKSFLQKDLTQALSIHGKLEMKSDSSPK